MNSSIRFLLSLLIIAAVGTICVQAQISIKEVNLDGSDIPGAPELDNASNRLNFDTVCMPGQLVKRISIRNTGSSPTSATPTLASLLELVSKAPTWALLRDDGTSFTNPLFQIPPLLTNIPAGDHRDFRIRFAPTAASPNTNDQIAIELSTSPVHTLGGFGAAVVPQILAVSPTTPLSFPTTTVGQQSASQSVMLRSLGQCGILISDVVVRNADGTPNPNYVVTSKPSAGTIVSAGIFSVQVAFKPVVPCAPEGRLVVLNGNGQPTGPGLVLRGLSTGSNVTFKPWDEIKLRGYVLSYIVSWYIPFPTPGSFEIINKPEPGGDPSCIAPTTIKRIEITKNTTEFSLVSNPATPFVIPASGSQIINVNFTPVTTLTLSVRTGEVAVTYDKNGVDATVFIDLTANINEGKIEFQQNSVSFRTVDFGKIRLGTASAVQTVKIVNTGTLKIDIGKSSVNSDSVVYALPFIIPPGGQVPKATRLDEITGINNTTSFKMQFAPQAAHFGPQKGYYLVEGLQGGRFKRTPYDTLYAIGTGVTPNFQRKLDTVVVGSTAINLTATTTIKDFWSNKPGRGIQLANLGNVDIESITITPIQPATAAAEFTLTRTQPFALSENGTYDETFTFTPTSGSPLVHLALVRVVYDSVGNDNKELTFVIKGNVLAPEVSAFEQTIDFGEVVVGFTGTPVTPAALLTNTGTAELVVFSPVLSDPNTPKVFTLNASEFPAKVPINSPMPPSGLVFAPDAEKEYTATLTIKTNTGGSNATLIFTLKGKGILPGIQSKATEIDFGSVRIGRTAIDSMYLRNTAPNTTLSVTGFTLSNSTEFTASADRTPPFDLTSTFQAVPVSFTPQKPAGPRLASVEIANTSQRQPSLVLKGEAALGRMQAFTTGVATPVDTVQFGNVFIQQQQSTELSLRNTGTFAYYLTRMELIGSDADQFSLSVSAPGVLLNTSFPADFSVDIAAEAAQAVSFFPTVAGEKNALLRVVGLDPVSGLAEDTTFVVLHGNATDLELAGDKGEGEIIFGDVLVGTTAIKGGVDDRFVRITNPSQNAVEILSTTIEGSIQFAMSNRAISIAPHSSDTVRVYFSPASATALPTTASVVVVYASGLRRTMSVSGRGVAPAARLDGVVYTSDPQKKTLAMSTDVGFSTTAAVVLTNEGSYPLLISDLRWEQDVSPWLSVDALPFTAFSLQPGSSRTMVFTFSPVAQDIRTARLLFTTNHVAMDAAADSSAFALEITAEGIYSAPPVIVEALLPVKNGKPGDRVDVPLSVQSTAMVTAGITRMEAVLRYDPTLLVPRSVAAGDAAPSFAASISEALPGRAVVTLDGGSSTLANGTAFIVSFDILLGSAVSSPLILDTENTVVTSAVPVVLTSTGGMVVLSEFCSADQRVIGLGDSPVLALVARPESGTMSFAVRIPTDDPATLEIYDSYGRTVAAPFSGSLPAGLTTVAVDSRSLSNGLYFAVLRSSTIVRTLRFTIVR